MKNSEYASPQTLLQKNRSPYIQQQLNSRYERERNSNIFSSSALSSISNGFPSGYNSGVPINNPYDLTNKTPNYSSGASNYTSQKSNWDWETSSKASGLPNISSSTRAGAVQDNFRSEVRSNAGYHGKRVEQWSSTKPVSRMYYKSLSVSVDSKKGIKGLRNIGNTCYMNSVLHALFNTSPLFMYFQRPKNLNFPKEKLTEVTNAFIELLAKVHEDSYKNSSPDAESTLTFKKAIEKNNNQFSGYFQQDAHEFLRKVLDSLHEELNRVTVRPRYRTIDPDLKFASQSKLADEWFEYLKCFDDSLITDHFTGQLLSLKVCDVCKKESNAFDNFLDLSLPFPQGPLKSKEIKLDQMLDLFFKEEVLEDPLICDKCQQRRRFYKKFSVWRLPDILVIHLKRFSFKNTLREKITTTVIFPINDLNVNKHCHASDHPSTKCTHYDLYAVINHYGTLSRGHYIAECKNLHNERWYQFDDENVTEVDINDSKYNTVGSSAPYLLFYKKK